MAAEKKYYWLQLKEDFFRQKEIKLLRRIAGGDTYTIIYQKMMLMSLKDGGKIYYEGVADDFAEEIALEIDEDLENVKVTINYLVGKGLLVTNADNEAIMSDVPNLVGSETDSARRVRKHRNAKQQLLHCNATVTKRNTDIEIDIDKDKEIEKEIDIKKTKKEKKIITYVPDELLNQAILDFIESRKKKSPMTERAIELMIKKLDRMTNDNDEKIEILNQSTIGGWKGIFPLKEKNNKIKSVLEEWGND